jgi:hypothetical protein
LKDIHDPMFKQTVRDFTHQQPHGLPGYGCKALNRWIGQGLRPAADQAAAYRPDVSLKVTGA